MKNYIIIKIFFTNINGIYYRGFEFKFVLFPFMTGEHIIPPIKLVCDKSIFLNLSGLGIYFNDNEYFIKQTKSFKVKVDEIPIKNKPLNFSGLIGNFEIIAEIENSSQIVLNENVNFIVKISGSENINSIPDITFPLVEKIKSNFNPKIFVNFDKKEPKIFGEKIFKFSLFPIKVGKDTIPSFIFSYFDEEEGKYLTKYTELIDINILKKSVVKE